MTHKFQLKPFRHVCMTTPSSHISQFLHIKSRCTSSNSNSSQTTFQRSQSTDQNPISFVKSWKNYLKFFQISTIPFRSLPLSEKFDSPGLLRAFFGFELITRVTKRVDYIHKIKNLEILSLRGTIQNLKNIFEEVSQKFLWPFSINSSIFKQTL